MALTTVFKYRLIFVMVYSMVLSLINVKLYESEVCFVYFNQQFILHNT